MPLRLLPGSFSESTGIVAKQANAAVNGGVNLGCSRLTPGSTDPVLLGFLGSWMMKLAMS